MIQFDQKLKEFAITNQLEQELALTHTLQQYVLSALAESGFFKVAAFHGGTSLKMLYELDRFSEDLDFLLKEPDPAFAWPAYLKKVKAVLEADGLVFEIQDKSSVKTTVQKVFLKTDSIGQWLSIDLRYGRNIYQKIRIKLEIDTNPPAGSDFETKFLNFPVPQGITTQTLSSNFALKLHALLCRKYLKGRDWYDFVFYAVRKIQPNYQLLANALKQNGPWANIDLAVNREWLLKALTEKIDNLDFGVAVKDVTRFIPPEQSQRLSNIWGIEYFKSVLKAL